jgi:hypothetical protein
MPCALATTIMRGTQSALDERKLGDHQMNMQLPDIRVQLEVLEGFSNPTLTAADRDAIAWELADVANIEWSADYIRRGGFGSHRRGARAAFALAITILVYIGSAATAGAAAKAGADAWDGTKLVLRKVIQRLRRKPESYQLDVSVYLVTPSQWGQVVHWIRPGVVNRTDRSFFRSAIERQVDAYRRNERAINLAVAQAAGDLTGLGDARVFLVELHGPGLDQVSVRTLRSLDEMVITC